MKYISQFFSSNGSCSIKRSNRCNVFRGKFASMMIFSAEYRLGMQKIAVAFTRGASVFFCHILHIFFLRAKKKMFWVYARRIVTFMANKKSLFNFSIMDCPRNPMSQICLCFSFSSLRQRTVIIFSGFCGFCRAIPNPTTLSLFYMLPKQFLNSLWSTLTFYATIFTFAIFYFKWPSVKLLSTSYTNYWYRRFTFHNGYIISRPKGVCQ